MTKVALDRYAQLRLGGLPASIPSDLASAANRGKVATYLTAWRRLATDRAKVSDLLHQLVAEEEASSEPRRALIRLRRALYGADYRAAWRALDGLDSHLRDSVDTALTPYLDDLMMCRAVEEHPDSWHPQWLAAQRDQTSRLIDHPTMVLGLEIAAPDLVPQISDYRRRLSRPGSRKRDRRVERSLISYLLRSSTKTTPFSTLGPVAVIMTDGAPDPHRAVVGGRVSRLSVYPVARVFNALGQDSDVLGPLPVRLSPDLREEDGHLLVDRTTWTFRDLDSRDDYAACDEATTRLTSRSVVDTLAVGFDDRELSFADLVKETATRYGIDAERAGDLVLDALRLGLVVLPSLSIHPHDTPEDVIDRLPPEDDGRLGSLRQLLVDYNDQAQNVSTEPVTVRRLDRVVRSRELVRELYAVAGVDAPEPRSVVFEDQMLASDAVSGPSPSISPTSAEEVMRFIELLDVRQPKRALLNGYAAQTLGTDRGRDVAEFLRRFRTELLDSYETYDVASVPDDQLADDAWLRWGSAWRWVQSQRALHSILAGLSYETLLIGADLSLVGPTVDLKSKISGVLAAAPHFHDAFRHTHVLIQSGDADNRWVLNDAFGGVGFVVSRFSHLLPGPATHYVRDVSERAARAGVVLTELSGGAVFTNLNLHSPVLDRHLVVPGDPPTSSSSRAILRDLHVSYEPRSEQVLLIDSAGRTVHPTYPGYLVPAATPRSHQALALFAPSATLTQTPADLTEHRPELGHVALTPRVALGDVVLVRATARLCAADLPSSDPCTATGYAAWLRFWAKTGLPNRVFARVHSLGASTRAKPFFLDPALILSLSYLYHLLRSTPPETLVELTEVVPDPDTAQARWNGTAHVSESMVGISITEEIR